MEDKIPTGNLPGNADFHIRKTYKLFCTGVSEIRGLTPRGTLGGYFDNEDAFVDSAKYLDRQQGTTYVTLNPVARELLAKVNNRLKPMRSGESTADKHTVRRRWLLIDCDPNRPAEIPATNEEKRAAWEKMQEIRAGLFARGIDRMVTADSANGYHLLIPVDEPNDKETTDLFRDVLNALQFLYGDERVKVDTSVFNPSRITKLYGTKPHKGDGTVDRPLRRSRFIDIPENLRPVDRGLLEFLALEQPQKPEADETPRGGGTRPDAVFDVPAFLKKHDIEVLQEKTWNGGGIWDNSKTWIVACPWNGHTNGSCHIIQAPDGTISARCKHDSCQGYKWQDFRKHYEPDAYDRKESGAAGESGDRRSQADRLLDYALETGAELFCDHLGAPHALVDGDPVPLNGACHAWLRRLVWEREKRTAMKDALDACCVD